ncbi:hypothetical protein H0H87_011052 [Tephrocybe sp. NHM501043]|nr:hypothetical protein H0H87_011052 [Tephrocybe sp. NHM501043]
MSEIDDIFSFKGKGPAVEATASTISLPTKKDKKKNKKRKRDEPTPDQPSLPKSSPETVIDTSNNITTSKRPKIQSKPKAAKAAKPSATEEFSDSRGSRSRKTTEEGWNIYKEDELGIRDEGGDTPLCPFDCDCCF